MHHLLQATRLLVSLVIGALLVPSASAESSISWFTRRADSVSDITNSLPECATSCFSSAVSNSTCSDSDLSCVCDNTSSIISAMEACTVSSCTIDEDLEAEKVINTGCGRTAHDTGNHLRSIFWPLYAAASISFGSRMLARSDRMGGTYWWDDWFIIASFAVLTAVSIGAEIMCIFGLGKDVWTLDDTNITIVLILFYIAEFAYVIESALTKTSIVVLYLRIFPSKTFRKLCYAMLAFIACFAVVFLVSLLTYCMPLSYVWSMWDRRHSGSCIDIIAHTYACAALNIIMDVTIFFMPIPKLMKLETDWKTKLGVILTFLLGLFVTICSIVRMTFLSGWVGSTNPTYDYGVIALWSLIELNAGVICACLPGMASLLRRLKKNREESRNKKSAYGVGSVGGGSKAFTGNGSGLRTIGGSGDRGAKEPGIVKTTSVSVHYNARSGDDMSDEMELMDQRSPPNYYVER